MDRVEAYCNVLDGKKVRTSLAARSFVDCNVDEKGNVNFVYNKSSGATEPLNCAFDKITGYYLYE